MHRVAFMQKTLSQINLTPAEVAELPAGIRKKIETAFSSTDNAKGNWMLVGSSSERIAGLVDQALARLPALAAARAAAVQERNIEKLLEIIADDMAFVDIDAELELENAEIRARYDQAELELENAEIRARYFAETKLLTANQVRERSGLKPLNNNEPASRWKRERRIFAVRRGGIDLYPAFQFKDGTPRPVINKILEQISKDLTPWQIAFWFDSGNGWLNGAEPRDCLDKINDVVLAAQRLKEPTIG